MKKAFGILSATFLLLPVLSAQASTTIANDIAKSTAWTTNGSPYIVSNPIKVAKGATLTINPGVIVQFAPGAGMDVSGSVVANGSNNGWGFGQGSKTYFTSQNDSTLTQNNNGGNWWGRNNPPAPMTTPAAGDYSGFVFESGSTGSFENVEIRYADKAIAAAGATLSVSDSNFINGNAGVSATGGSLNLKNDNFTTDGQAVMVDYSTQFTHGSNDFSGNSYDGIGMTGDTYGSNYSFAGGDAPYFLFSNPTVSAGKTLTIGGGVTLQSSGSGNSISVLGGTLTSGSVSQGYRGNQNNLNSAVILNGVSLQAFSGASVSLSNTTVENISGAAAIAVWNGSTLSASALTVNAVSADGIDAYGTGTTVSLKNSTISNFGASGAGLNVFNDATANIQASAFNTGGDGIVAFNHATVSANNITVKNCTDGGIVSFGDDTYANTSLSIQNSEFTANGFGMYPINHTTVSASNNSFFGNSIGVLANPGFSYDFSNNWWGDKSGPYNATTNPKGTGDQVSDGILFKPWLTRDPIGSQNWTGSCSGSRNNWNRGWQWPSSHVNDIGNQENGRIPMFRSHEQGRR